MTRTGRTGRREHAKAALGHAVPGCARTCRKASRKGGRDMELIVFMLAVIVLDVLALRYAADSRDGFEYAR